MDANRRQYSRNLAAGLGLSAFAVFVAFFIVVNRPDINLEDPRLALVQLAISYVPYVTVIIVVEFLAFFFLKLYRQNAEDERFIRNEITSVNLKILAIYGAIQESGVVDKKFLENLILMERNQVLSEGQSTVEIEKTKMNAEAFKDGVSFLGSLSPNGWLKDVAQRKP